MIHKGKHIIIQICILFGCFLLPGRASAAEQTTRIHFIALQDNTDAILLESNGHFGMVDCGEDWNYPDGSDSRYPLRADIMTDYGFDASVIAYLEKCGVTSLDFIVATHAHSDHIGCVDEILEEIPCGRLYIQAYPDESITDQDRLWDNLYVYDAAVSAAEEHNVQIISTIDESNKTIQLGEMTLTFIHYGRKAYAEDDNENCLTLKVEACGYSALLTSDITGEQLYEKLDEIGQIDLLKLPHHGALVERLEELVTALNPSVAIASRVTDGVPYEVTSILEEHGADLYTTNCDAAAVAAIFDPTGLRMSYMGYSSSFWFTCLSKAYYLDEYGRPYTGRQEIDGKTFVFHHTGACAYELGNEFMQDDQGIYVQEEDGSRLCSEWLYRGDSWMYSNAQGYLAAGWEKIDGQWYYFDQDGLMQTGWLLDDDSWYYLQPDGSMLTDSWKQVAGEWYYLKEDGRLAVDEWVEYDGEWYYLGFGGVMQ